MGCNLPELVADVHDPLREHFEVNLTPVPRLVMLCSGDTHTGPFFPSAIHTVKLAVEL